MFLSEELIAYVTKILRDKHGTKSSLQQLKPIAGGDINDAFGLAFENKKYFLKVNDAASYRQMFFKEAESLKYFAGTHAVRVPEVIAYGECTGQQFLLLSWIENGEKTDGGQSELGRNMAHLHRNTAPQFGFEFDNFMGSLVQSNARTASWTEFFINNRLEPQLSLATDLKLINTADRLRFDKLFIKLEQLYPAEPPALVHGDLWSGNYLVDKDEVPYLIDPAISFSNREVDLAMTQLFGGFSAKFYNEYNETYALESGWQERADLWNIYPLLIHLNIFGRSYHGRLMTCLDKFL